MSYVDLVPLPIGQFQAITYLGDTLPCAEAVPPSVSALIVSGIQHLDGTEWLSWMPDAPDWANSLTTLEYGKEYLINVSAPVRWTFVGGEQPRSKTWLWIGAGVVGLVGLVALALSSSGKRNK